MYWQIILDFLLKFMILRHMLDQEDWRRNLFKFFSITLSYSFLFYSGEKGCNVIVILLGKLILKNPYSYFHPDISVF